MTQLFRRRCRVTVSSSAPPTGFVGQHPNYFVPQPNGIVIENLRVQFKIEKSLEKTPNTADITITNCNPQTRAFLQSKPLTVLLEAGYGDDLKTLIQADARYVYSEVNEADWETKIQLGEGDRAYRYARASRSYPKGTNVVTALQDVASAMGLKLSKDVIASNALQSQFATGRTLHGPARDELSRLLAPYGYHWSIQGGQLQILQDNLSAPGAAYQLSQSTGMIKSPEYSIPEKPGKPSTLKTEQLLEPALFPGAMMSVDSLFVSGFFRINKLTHTGDTHGDDWTTECESTARSGLAIVS